MLMRASTFDAGNAFVEAIKPAVKSTARTGSNSGYRRILAACLICQPPVTGIPYWSRQMIGVGTKLKIAIESGIHNTVGIDLVAMCVNDLVVQGAEPLFFLDYLATGKLELAEATAIVEGIAEGCRQAARRPYRRAKPPKCPECILAKTMTWQALQ